MAEQIIDPATQHSISARACQPNSGKLAKRSSLEPMATPSKNSKSKMAVIVSRFKGSRRIHLLNNRPIIMQETRIAKAMYIFRSDQEKLINTFFRKLKPR